jgi:hypothetical protein
MTENVGSKVAQVTVRMTVAEKEAADAFAQVLFERGKLDEVSVAGAMRIALKFTISEYLKDMEAKRLGGKKN